MALSKEKIKKMPIPQKPGCYQFLNPKGEIIYIGKAANLFQRLNGWWAKSANLTPAKRKMLKEVKAIKWTTTDSEIEAFLLEANLIKKHQPFYNVAGRDDKRYVYIHISEDEIPGPFLVRSTDAPGQYFGPLTSAAAARETLRALRKIWPYCLKKKKQKKPCFYCQLNLCPGVCVGQISRQEYLSQYLKPLALFLAGRKKKLLTDFKKTEKKLRQQNQLEAAEKIKQTIANLEKVLAHTKILTIAEKYAADSEELSKLLKLPRPAQRIEGYDVSNLFGQWAVGSMVVFAGGEPAKSLYRRFKIKTAAKNDLAMLKEVLSRRLKYLTAKAKKTDNSLIQPPDLIVLDGGRAQLQTAQKLLAKYNLKIPTIALAKDKGLRSARARDKIFLTGRSSALVLPLASPALHLIKRVRDEAHRFALAYHRQRRKKNLLK